MMLNFNLFNKPEKKNNLGEIDMSKPINFNSNAEVSKPDLKYELNSFDETFAGNDKVFIPRIKKILEYNPEINLEEFVKNNVVNEFVKEKILNILNAL